MNKTLEENIVDYMNKSELNIEEGLDLIDSLYWADWDLLDKEYPEVVEKIFRFLNNNSLSNEEISQILKLYNNPHGAYTNIFAQLIVNIYERDKKVFLKSLNLEKEEAINLVYVFRNHDIKLDEDINLLNLISTEILSEEEVDTAEKFIKMYVNICNT